MEMAHPHTGSEGQSPPPPAMSSATVWTRGFILHHLTPNTSTFNALRLLPKGPPNLPPASSSEPQRNFPPHERAAPGRTAKFKVSHWTPPHQGSETLGGHPSCLDPSHTSPTLTRVLQEPLLNLHPCAAPDFLLPLLCDSYSHSLPFYC